MISPLDKAISVLGSQAKLARACHVSDEAVRKWRVNKVPAERVKQIVEATGGKVERYELRPDLYEQPK